jgi:hypothetical protein
MKFHPMPYHISQGWNDNMVLEDMTTSLEPVVSIPISPKASFFVLQLAIHLSLTKLNYEQHRMAFLTSKEEVYFTHNEE